MNLWKNPVLRNCEMSGNAIKIINIFQIYEEKLKIKNVSSTSRQLKALPPKTKYFTITKSIPKNLNFVKLNFFRVQLDLLYHRLFFEYLISIL